MTNFLESTATILTKLDCDVDTREEWNSAVIEYLDSFFRRYLDPSDQGLQLASAVRQRCYPKLDQGDTVTIGTLPEWPEFIPDKPLPVQKVLEIFDHQVADFQGESLGIDTFF